LLPVPARPPEPTIASLRDSPAEGDALARYWRFYWAVADAQLARWLPRRPSRVLDISGDHGRCAERAAEAGHTVIEVRDPLLERRTAGVLAAGASGHGSSGPGPATTKVLGDSGSLGFLGGASMDAVLAENRVLSRHLATEETIAEIARVLRPGGRVLLCVDSLTLGMALLAEQSHWAHLSDVPSAEVVLVPWPDGTITRCFGADQLRELLAEVGLEVSWIRPRTALSPSTVEHVLASSPDALPRLVRTELNAPPGDESLGFHLLASAKRL
jgi:SAM-dependent methyltransferase